MKGFICGICGHVAFNEAPDKCPVCGAAKQVFKESDKIMTASNEGPKEKHVPVIKVVKTCGLMADGCTDVHVRIGSVAHPMEAAHFIKFVDLYVDKKWVVRTYLTPDCNPAACGHIKAKSGMITAIEFCNLHGHWMSETEL